MLDIYKKVVSLTPMKKNTLKYGNVVEILTENPDSINRFAVVNAVKDDGVLVSNMNMPFSGTLGLTKFAFEDVRLVRRHT